MSTPRVGDCVTIGYDRMLGWTGYVKSIGRCDTCDREDCRAIVEWTTDTGGTATMSHAPSALHVMHPLHALAAQASSSAPMSESPRGASG